MDQVDQVDVTALAFAQWISELKARTNSTQQQMLGEMGIIRNGVSSQCAEFSDFKRNSTNVSQQQQQQLSDMRERLQEAYNEIASLKKAKAQTDQEIAADYQSLVEQLNIRQVESDTLKKQYSATTQQLQQQIVQLQTELNELRMQREETHRMATGANENFMRTCAELELTTSSNATELRKTRTDHDQAIANLADNMNRWNDTIRDLSREFHEFQKLMTGNQQRLQQQITETVLPSGGHSSAPQPQPERVSQQGTPVAQQLPPQMYATSQGTPQQVYQHSGIQRPPMPPPRTFGYPLGGPTMMQLRAQ